jgi:hypothetical protein
MKETQKKKTKQKKKIFKHLPPYEEPKRIENLE